MAQGFIEEYEDKAARDAQEQQAAEGRARMDRYWEGVRTRHAKSVARGEHDGECEWSAEENFHICNCSKRRREAAGFTTPPTEDLDFPPPDCPHCYKDLEHDGDGWNCYACHLSWNSSGSGTSAEFTDDHGDLSRCAEHGRRGCWHCREAKRMAR